MEAKTISSPNPGRLIFGMVGFIIGGLVAIPGLVVLWFFQIGLRHGEGNGDVGLIAANHEKLFQVALSFTGIGAVLAIVGGALMWRYRVRKA